MEIKILHSVAQEVAKEPLKLKESIYGALDRLSRGEKIPMPLSRPLPSIAKGLFELRFSYSAGEYRVFYYLKVKEAIYVIHAMKKKTQKIEKKIVKLLRARIRSLS